MAAAAPLAGTSLEERVAQLPEKLGELGDLLDKLAVDVRTAGDVQAAGAEDDDVHREAPPKVTEVDRGAAAHRAQRLAEERAQRKREVTDAAAKEIVHQTERWFIRRGMATMIDGYRFTEHALPRMLPALALMASLATFVWLVPYAAGSGRRVLVAVVVVVSIVTPVAAELVSRRLPRLSRKTTIAVLSAYEATPVVVPLVRFAVLGSWAPLGSRVFGVLGFVIFFVVVFVATRLATTYSLGALLGRAIRRTVFDMRNSVRRLLGWALPLLLIANVFLFFTAELWQAMNALPWWRLSLVFGLFAAITIVAAANRLGEEITRAEQELSARRLSEVAAGTPVAEVPTDELERDGRLRATPLNGRQTRNLLVMLATRQLAQAAVVGVALLLFFIVLGLIVVTPDTAVLWIGSQPTPSRISGVPVAMPRNATLFAAFGAMLFAVTSMSDDEYRRQFFAPIINEIETTLAVRAIYHAVKNQQLVSH